jgi:hypothetical protein
MKRSFALITALVVVILGALFFAGCDIDSGGGGTGSNTTGSLKVRNESSVTLLNINWGGESITDGDEEDFEPGNASSKVTVNEETMAYIRFVIKQYDFASDSWSTFPCRTQEIITVSPGDDIEFRFMNSTIVVDISDSSHTGTLESMELYWPGPGLTVKNDSSYDLQEVIWQRSEYSVTPIALIAKNTEGNFRYDGSGFLYFTRKDPMISLRTIAPIVIERSGKGGSTIYTITDDAKFIEVGSATNEGALKDIRKKVVFFDDAEGVELKDGYESTDGVFTYDTMIGDYWVDTYYNPKNGNRSIAIGGNVNKTQLSLKISLDATAKFSFYYANKYNFSLSDATKNAAFYIDGVKKITLETADTNWTSVKYDLEPGDHDLVWEKTDGLYYSESPSYRYFFSLDDILIEYE